MNENYKVLDIDMDYFLDDIPTSISTSCTERVDENYYKPWNRESVIKFLENNLGLSKDNKIKGKIVTHHHEALYYWRNLIKESKLKFPFEVIHVDSHADLGMGHPSWTFIFEKLLGIDVYKRSNIENYKNEFEEYELPDIGDYLLFAIAFRWISKLTYIYNPIEDGDDYYLYIMKNFNDKSGKIQLPYNSRYSATECNNGARALREYLSTSILEPEVEFNRIKEIENVKYNGDFDFITFCISPNYTPKSADFIIDIIREYIEL